MEVRKSSKTERNNADGEGSERGVRGVKREREMRRKKIESSHSSGHLTSSFFFPPPPLSLLGDPSWLLAPPPPPPIESESVDAENKFVNFPGEAGEPEPEPVPLR